jgi:hypothetical protein
MERVNLNRYRVKPGEKVTFDVRGRGVINSAAAFTVDAPMTTDPQAGTYLFTVVLPSGEEHRGRIMCSFPPGSPEDAMFTTHLSGSLGGSFPGPTIRKTSPSPAQNFTFEVV